MDEERQYISFQKRGRIEMDVCYAVVGCLGWLGSGNCHIWSLHSSYGCAQTLTQRLKITRLFWLGNCSFNHTVPTAKCAVLEREKIRDVTAKGLSVYIALMHEHGHVRVELFNQSGWEELRITWIRAYVDYFEVICSNPSSILSKLMPDSSEVSFCLLMPMLYSSFVPSDLAPLVYAPPCHPSASLPCFLLLPLSLFLSYIMTWTTWWQHRKPSESVLTPAPLNQ